MTRLPFLLSIVHGGSMLPRELVPRLALTPADVFFDSDPWTREIFALGEAVQGRLEADVARAVVDLDRDPNQRPPEHPDGVVKSVTLYGKKVWNDGEFPTDDEVRRLLDRYHRPYHEVLERTAVRGAVRLGLDCHSMAPVGPPNAPDPGQDRPLFCLGNLGDEEGGGDDITCPQAWMVAFRRALEEEFAAVAGAGDQLVAFNRPYAGGYILRRHGHGRTPWIHLVINRRLYLKTEEGESGGEVPDSERETIAELRLRLFRTLTRFAERI